MLRKLRTAAAMPFGTLALVGAIWLLLWPAKLVTLLMPSRHLAKVLGADSGLGGASPALDPGATRTAMRLADAFAIAARNSPVPGSCYAQALIAHALLSFAGAGHAVFFGVRRKDDSGGIEAHAWVVAGETVICGGDCSEGYTVVRCFVSA